MRDLPPPLPPAERTIGQLVAESIRAYGNDFFRVLPLGLPIALLDELAFGRSGTAWLLVFAAFAPLLSLAFAYAAALIGEVDPTWRRLGLATAVGTATLVPAGLLLPWFAILAVAYLAAVGLVVPVVVVEGSGPVAAVRRALALARVDYVHALGSLATLVILFFLSRLVLVQLLQGQADTTIRVAGFLADIVLAPMMLLGAAILYVDQAARMEVGGRSGSGGGSRKSGRSRSARAAGTKR